jgi:GNAT superfamily N-acetyltransferase
MNGAYHQNRIFSDLPLAQRLEKAEGRTSVNFVEARARVSPDIKPEWKQVAGAFAMFDGPDSPLSQTFGLGMFENASDAQLEEIEAFFAERNTPVFHEVSPLAGVELQQRLCKRGYVPAEFTSVMYLQLGQPRESAMKHETRVKARAIEPHEGELWATTSARGWSETIELSNFMLEFGRVSTAMGNAAPFLAELDGQPIGTGLLSLQGDVALLAGASTVPDARKQGAQRVLLDERLRHAREHGCEIAMMCALPGSASQRNAERQGFRIAYTRTKWHLKQGAEDYTELEELTDFGRGGMGIVPNKR